MMGKKDEAKCFICNKSQQKGDMIARNVDMARRQTHTINCINHFIRSACSKQYLQ